MNGRWGVVVAALCAMSLTGCVQPEVISAVVSSPPPISATITGDLPAQLAATGPYEVETTVIAREDAEGYGGGTIYAPVADDETFGAIVASPGYTALQESIAWYGPLLASHGFVVFTIDTLDREDQPDRRAQQLGAALDWLLEESPAAAALDSERLGALGHSMGAAGALALANGDARVRAVVGLTPYHRPDFDLSRVGAATLLVGVHDDTVTPVVEQAIPAFDALENATARAYVELAAGTHMTPSQPDPTIGALTVAWARQFLGDDDTADALLCPVPHPDGILSDARVDCPLGG